MHNIVTHSTLPLIMASALYRHHKGVICCWGIGLHQTMWVLLVLCPSFVSNTVIVPTGVYQNQCFQMFSYFQMHLITVLPLLWQAAESLSCSVSAKLALASGLPPVLFSWTAKKEIWTNNTHFCWLMLAHPKDSQLLLWWCGSAMKTGSSIQQWWGVVPTLAFSYLLWHSLKLKKHGTNMDSDHWRPSTICFLQELYINFPKPIETDSPASLQFTFILDTVEITGAVKMMILSN